MCVVQRLHHGKQSTIIVYVDDILILCEHESEIRRIMDASKDKYIEVKKKPCLLQIIVIRSELLMVVLLFLQMGNMRNIQHQPDSNLSD